MIFSGLWQKMSQWLSLMCCIICSLCQWKMATLWVMESHSWMSMEAVWACWTLFFVSSHAFLGRQPLQLEVLEMLTGKSLLQMLNIITIFWPRLLLEVLVRLSRGSSNVAILTLTRFALLRIMNHCFFLFVNQYYLFELNLWFVEWYLSLRLQ